MPDIAELGFKTNTRPLKDAEDALDDLAVAAGKTEKQTDQLNDEFKKSSASAKVFGGAMTGLERATTGVGRAFKTATAFVVGFVAGLAGAFTAQFSISEMAANARELSASIAELSTLLPTGSRELDTMADAARSMAKEFGTSATAQVSGFYQAVSAGASDAAAAIEIMDSANRLAIGGITEVETGVDILTTATNAYAVSGLAAADASDALFVGMRAGKTTIGELSSGLGNVIPIAASLGVSFDELVASVAALTTQGLSTASAITSIRAILTAVAKPTNEASKLAAQLGIDFSTAALRAQGLSGFLQSVNEKTRGSSDALALLFGSVEALNGALAFAGAGGETFNSILDQMTDKAGATQEAFDKVASSLDNRYKVALGAITESMTTFGTQLLETAIPAVEKLSEVLTDFADNEDTVRTAASGMIQGFELVARVAAGLVIFIGQLSIELQGLAKAATLVGKLDFSGAADAWNEATDASVNFKNSVTQTLDELFNSESQGSIQNRISGAFEESAKESVTKWNEGISNLSGGAIDHIIAEPVKESADKATVTLNDLGVTMDKTSGKTKNAAKNTREFVQELDQADIKLVDIGTRLSDSFFNAIANGENAFKALGETALSVLSDIGSALIRNGLTGLFGGSSLFGNTSPLFGMFGTSGGLFAKGGAFTNGVQKFASGGVVDRPTSFGMASGRTGLMGEAGPEAILPLSRLSNGDLGVKAQPSSGPAQPGVTQANIMVDVSGARGNAEIQEMVAAGVRIGLDEFSNRVLPVRVNQINRQPRVR